jgi:regulator of sirC expression with transglutaminase-like and TPR domain
MIKVSLAAGQVVLDPMTGQSLTREDLLDRLGGAHMQLLGAEEEVPMGLFLQASSRYEILERMLRNLREIYASRGRHERELAVINRLLVLLPESWSDYRERAQVLVQLGQLDAALVDLQTYLHAAQDASDADAVRQQVAKLQAKS